MVTDVRILTRRQDEAAERGVEERAASILVRENGICLALEAGSSWVASRNPGEASVVETSEQVRASGHTREEQQFPPGASFVCVGSAELSQLGRGLPLASD